MSRAGFTTAEVPAHTKLYVLYNITSQPGFRILHSLLPAALSINRRSAVISTDCLGSPCHGPREEGPIVGQRPSGLM